MPWAFCFFVYLLDKSLKNGSRSAFSELVSSISYHVLDSLCPSYRSGKLSYKISLDLCRVCIWLCVYILIYRAFRSVELSSVDSCFKLNFAGSISGEMDAPPTFSGRARFAPASFINSQALFMPSIEPEITICPGQL